VVPKAGYSGTAPAGGQYLVTVAAAQVAAGRNFGEAPYGSVAGTVYNDLNADGSKAAGDPGLGGWVVWLDQNRDGLLNHGERSTTTTVAGAYKFPALAPGTYYVREQLKPGYRPTQPAALPLTIALGPARDLAGQNLGVTKLNLIAGTVFNDVNSNGTRQTTEAGLAGWVVWLDQNNNKRLDAGEKSTTTDAAGNWSFKTLPPGTYHVRVVPKTGYKLTTPLAAVFDVPFAATGLARTGLLFGEHRIV
jgi:hypothetical protein